VRYLLQKLLVVALTHHQCENPKQALVLNAFGHENAVRSFERTTPTLPVELLAQIILEAAAYDRSIIPVLMRVSRLWHNTTINEPRLWNIITLTLGHARSSRALAMQAARRCIERSGSLDLFIKIRIMSNFWPCECYQDDENLACQECMAYIDRQRGPIEMLTGSYGNHMARWRELYLWVFVTAGYQQKLWVNRVLSPLIDGRPTPRLQTLSLTSCYDIRLSFCHTPLLQQVTLKQASHLHIANWKGVKEMVLENAPPQSLVENGAYTTMTHLILVEH
jgi:hypothetical protein